MTGMKHRAARTGRRTRIPPVRVRDERLLPRQSSLRRSIPVPPSTTQLVPTLPVLVVLSRFTRQIPSTPSCPALTPRRVPLLPPLV